MFAPDGLVARKEGSTWTYYTFDQQGNVAQRLNASEAVQTSRVFDAWGEGAETTQPKSADCWNYNGQWGYYYDRETALYYCQNRMYDASTGRWINRDPIGYAGGVNLYGYSGNGPVGTADPSGLMMLSLVESWAWNAAADEANEKLRNDDKTRQFPLIPQEYYYYTDNFGNLRTHFKGGPSPEEANRNQLMLVPPAGLANLPRRPAAKLIAEWEDINGQKWPTCEGTGKKYILHHEKPLADGGEDHGRNARPVKNKDEHTKIHRDNGDYARWGKRGAFIRRMLRQYPRDR